MKSDKELFEKIAKDYAEEYGRRLKEDRDRIEASDAKLSPLEEKRIYRQVEQRVRGGKRGWRAGLAVACALAMLILPLSFRVLRPLQYNTEAPDFSAESDASEPDDMEAGSGYERFTLVAQLPDGYQIAHWEQDKGQTIYYLAEAQRDDVVLVMEQAEENLSALGLKESRLKGEPVYCLARSDYNILTFIKDDIQYTLTCRYDMSTLLVLGSSIL